MEQWHSTSFIRTPIRILTCNNQWITSLYLYSLCFHNITNVISSYTLSTINYTTFLFVILRKPQIIIWEKTSIWAVLRKPQYDYFFYIQFCITCIFDCLIKQLNFNTNFYSSLFQSFALSTLVWITLIVNAGIKMLDICSSFFYF